METPEHDRPPAVVSDQDAGPTASGEQLAQEPERDQAEGEDSGEDA